MQTARFACESKILTYTPEELLGTKLRALYQRKKGRDLYDLWYATHELPLLDKTIVINIFNHYMKFGGAEVSRAEFEKNLFYKRSDKIFNNDIFPLLSANQAGQYNLDVAYSLVQNEFISRLSGEAWKGVGLRTSVVDA